MTCSVHWNVTPRAHRRAGEGVANSAAPAVVGGDALVRLGEDALRDVPDALRQLCHLVLDVLQPDCGGDGTGSPEWPGGGLKAACSIQKSKAVGPEWNSVIAEAPIWAFLELCRCTQMC